MKKFLLILSLFICTGILNAQEIDHASAKQLALKNSEAIGIEKDVIESYRVSNAFYNSSSSTSMVYLIQSYKGLPVYNQVLSLAFREGSLISKAGTLIPDIAKAANFAGTAASLSATMAIEAAFKEAKVAKPGFFPLVSSSENGRVVNYGLVKGVTEDVICELLWVPVNEESQIKLAWQVQVVPQGKSDWWQIQVDARTGTILNKINLTVYENHNHTHLDKLGSCFHKAQAHHFFDVKKINSFNPPPPPTVTNGTYRVVPMPVESPNHGSIGIVNEPWLAAGASNNAITNGWHFDGTNNYNLTRGNNVFAYLDIPNSNSPNSTTNWPDTSSTAIPSLSFLNTPNFTLAPNNVANRKFALTNLFYWNNLVHDVTYQYGFTEVTGNFQTDNMGRGGNGNDYVQAEAQDGGGTNNANFSTPADGNRPRMQMYLWDPASSITTLHVNAPGPIVANYGAVESAFSPNNLLANVGPVTADVVYFNDASGGTHEACTGPPSNTLTGKIALINRGGCNFTVKVLAAQAAGAVGVIMVNNAPGLPITMGGGPEPTITIPAVMVSDVDGALFAANLGSGLNVTLSGTPAGTVNLDGDLDNGIIVHEYGHGISNRLTGGPNTTTCLQNQEQGGEGWSDYFALMMTHNWATANVSDGGIPRGIGTYAFGQGTTGVGIRTHPYSTNMGINPLTYTNLPTQVVPHGVGTVLCTALWDMTWAIIQQQNSITANIYNATATGGNVIAMRLVMEGLRLQNCSPGFMDVRNAILTADQNLYGGAYRCTIWQAFARRGMGFSANQGSAFSIADGTAAFDLPPGPSITAQPANVSVCTGTNTSFTVTATGNGLSYQWQVSTDGGTSWTNLTNTAPYAGVTTNNLTITGVTVGLNNNRYRVVVNGGCVPPTTVNSNGAILTITTSTPSITSQPANTTVCSGSNATFTVVATGTSLSYNWQVSTDGGGTWNNVSPAVTTTTLTLTAVTLGMNNNQYRAQVTGSCGTPVTVNSNGGILNVTTGGLSITSQPGNTTVCAGSNASFTVAATGSNLTYNWQVSTDGGATWNNLSPAVTTPTLTLNAVTPGMNNNQYRSELTSTGTCSGSATSAPATLTVNSLPAITSQPVSSTICTGTNTSFTVAGSGTGVSYQWQVGTAGCAGSFTNLTNAAPYSGVTTATLNITGATTGMNGNVYRAIVSGTCTPSLNSSCVTLSVNNAASITGQPANTTVCPAATANFSVTATGVGVTYQWQVSTDGGVNYTDIAGATNPAFAVANVTPAMNNNRYRVVVFSCGPNGVNSSAAILTVNTPSTISSQPANIAVCAGDNASFSVAGAGLTGFQWQVSTNGGTTWTNITGATTSTYSITGVTVAMNGNQYRAVVSGTCVTGLNSTPATLTLNTPVQITTQPANTAVCVGNSAQISIAATGTTITYQWQESINGGAFQNIVNGTPYSGATTNTLTINPATLNLSGRQYRVIATGAPCGAVTSSVASFTVNTLPIPVLTLASYSNITPYTRASFNVTVSPPGSYAYVWYKNNTIVPGLGSDRWDVSVDDFGEYYAIVTNVNTGCSNLTNRVSLRDSASNILFIYPNPTSGTFMVRYFSSNNASMVRTINVYDSKGSRVYSSAYNISRTYDRMEVKLDHAASGVYMVELTDDKGERIATERVVIRK